MSEDEDRNGEGKDSWLSEHDSIQSELIKMKQELLRERGQKDGSMIDKVDEEPSKRSGTGVKDEAEAPETEKGEEASSGATPASGEMTIKQMLGGDLEPSKDDKNKENSSGSECSPKRLEEGKIPVAPGLSSKIANVIQLENNLKRRKFEMEKRSRKRTLPPPPKPPSSSMTPQGKEEHMEGKKYHTPSEKRKGTSSNKEESSSSSRERKSKLVRRVKRKMIKKRPPTGEDTGGDPKTDAGSSESDPNMEAGTRERKEGEDTGAEGKMEGAETSGSHDDAPSSKDLKGRERKRKKDPLEKLKGLLGEK